MMKWVLPLGASLLVPTAVIAQGSIDASVEEQELSARSIVERAFAAAGGDSWRYPGTIWLKGRYLDFKQGITPVIYEPYELYRIQPRDHPNGNVADGNIRHGRLRAALDRRNAAVVQR